NGNLVNSTELKKELQEAGVIFQSSSDAEVICSLIARERVKSNTTEEAILKTMKKLKGAYSFIVMTKRKMIVVRDPYGFKPLSIGKLGDNTVFSSETCALDSIEAEYVRDIKPGEVYCISDEKATSQMCDVKVNPAVCIFEYIYFSRPDSYIAGVNVHCFRKEIGKFLARNDNITADVVCGVPDSGLDAALGYSKESKIPYDIAFIKNKYVGRTFIKLNQSKRKTLAQVKLNPLKGSVEGKSVLLVDDSLVRGTMIESTIKLLKSVGAKEVHVRIASPAYVNVCYFGTDVDNKEDLMANRMNKEEMRKHIGADSLEFLRVEDLNEIAKSNNIEGHCEGCFSSKYPMEVPDKIERDIFEKIC
ncbi:MAG: amidophosphoribosyltransferase, partial [Oscillospiraceae bacterium]|nr:amidophosphoribosyltransferase [Oscillospiraceae bacterium]